MRSHVKKWGNSLAVRLPHELALSLGLQDGSAVEIETDGAAISIALAPPAYRLEALLAAMPKEPAEGETDWGAAEGDEIW